MSNGHFYCDAIRALPGHGELAARPLQKGKGRAATLSGGMPRTSKCKSKNKGKNRTLARYVVLVPCRHYSSGAHSPTGGILVRVALAVVVWVLLLALVLPVLVTLGVPASPSGIFRLRLPPPVLPKNRQDFPTAPLTQKTQARVAHPNLLVAGAVQPGRNSTSDKHRQNRARNICR